MAATDWWARALAAGGLTASLLALCWNVHTWRVANNSKLRVTVKVRRADAGLKSTDLEAEISIENRRRVVEVSAVEWGVLGWAPTVLRPWRVTVVRWGPLNIATPPPWKIIRSDFEAFEIDELIDELHVGDRWVVLVSITENQRFSSRTQKRLKANA